MIGILGKIFGSGNAVESVVNLIDSIHTSDEEEIQAKAKAKTDLLSAYAPFKIAQRLLAIMFTVTFLGAYGNTADARAVLAEFWIGEIMLTIVLFYFGGGAFEGVTAQLQAKRKAK